MIGENEDFKKRPLAKMVASQKKGEAVGIYSVCSANKYVLEACMLQAKMDQSVVLIEATSNQVNQFGGYTGMNPAQFVSYINETAATMKFPLDRIILGGDHLGPNVWQNENAASAMAKAGDMIRDYVRAGFEKIHLDASMRCIDDPGDHHTPLKDEVIAERAAELCAIAEAAYNKGNTKSHAPIYIIGTEVPIPGGAKEAEEKLCVTQVNDAKRTIEISKEAFYTKGLQLAWDRVIATVVQPGVEFSDDTVFDYNHEKAKDLSDFIAKNDQLIFEAHSTDYQTNEALRRLVQDHFAILKVGPGLTYAFREAVFALETMEIEWLGHHHGVILSDLKHTLENVMLEKPVYWNKYYHGNQDYLSYARKYSYSDRSRYYWLQPEINDSLLRLIDNLSLHPIPLSLLDQFMPNQYRAVRLGEIMNKPVQLIYHKINEVTNSYAEACGLVGMGSNLKLQA